MPKILFIGDIVGKGGRQVLAEVLPQWQEKYKPDVVIVNVENMAHGKGVTPNTMASIADLNIDCYTSGNHVFDKFELTKECFEKYPSLIRPANYESLKFKEDKEPKSVPGYGYYRFSKTLIGPDKSGHLLPSSFVPLSGITADKEGEEENTSQQQFLVLNFSGTVFMDKGFPGEISNPFHKVDQILTEQAQKGDIIIVDFHAEATSEKVAFGYYLDGRAAAVLGTHTHVPTADARVLPGGTAYITDGGMTGPQDSVIGVKKENVLKKFLDPGAKFKNEVVEDGVMMINGVLIETSGKGQATRIEKLYQEI